MVGDRMVGSWSDMNQGSRTGKGTAFMVRRRPEELCPGGDRVPVVAKKRVTPVEPRGAGRWKRERTQPQEQTAGSAVRLNKAERSGPMGMDGTSGVDRTHVGNPRKRDQRRQMVQVD